MNPDDAIVNRQFGIAAAMTEDNALICSDKDGLYSFKRIDQHSVQQRRMDARCSQVVMTNDWAAVSSREKVVVYQNEAGVWHKIQTLVPDNYLARREKRRRPSIA